MNKGPSKCGLAFLILKKKMQKKIPNYLFCFQDEHPLVAEAAVVGFPHEVKGESVYAYIVLKETGSGLSEPEIDVLIKELKSSVKTQIAGYAVPEKLQICSGLPKTRSGKIMRRILRKVAANQPDDLGDVSTLADPTVVTELVSNHAQMRV